jgi:signal transduction histidine kinase
MVDQSKQTALEAEILKLKNQLSLNWNIVKSFPQQIWVLDDKGTVIISSHNLDLMFSHITRHPLKDITGENLYEMFKKFAPKPLIEMLKRNDAIVKGMDRVMTFEESVLINGKKRVFLSYKKRFIEPATNCIYLLGMSVEITGQKVLEDKVSALILEAKDASQIKQTFLQSYLHDLKTPIGNIMSAVDLLHRNPNANDLAFCLDSIKASANRLDQYVDRLNDTPMGEKAKDPIEINPVNIQKLFAEVLSSFSVLAKSKNLELNANIKSDLPEIIRTDKMRLVRIISNLISNALKYTVEGKVDMDIYYTKTDQGDLLEIHIIDTGVGIDQSFQKEVFSPLVRVARDDSISEPGSGLGLSIVKVFIEDLNGQISLNSTLGKGSHFIVMLPLHL